MAEKTLEVRDGNLGHVPRKKTAEMKLEEIVAEYIKKLIKQGEKIKWEQ